MSKEQHSPRKKSGLWLLARAKWCSVTAIRGGAAIVVLYVVACYLVLPAAWNKVSHRYEPLAAGISFSFNSLGLPSDPVNLAFIGSEDELTGALAEAGWCPSLGASIGTVLRTVENFLLDRQYDQEPISSQYLHGRIHDMSYHKSSGKSHHRGHVRFWLSDEASTDGRPIWYGAAHYDCGIRFCIFTGRLTHRISADLDAQRHAVVADIVQTGRVESISSSLGTGSTLEGMNGSGDRYFTDGQMTVLVLRPSKISF